MEGVNSMRKLLWAIAIMAIAASAAHALPSTLSVGIYTDEARSAMSVDYAGAVTQFEVWVWWMPSEKGLHAVSFYLAYPANVTQDLITPNPNREYLIGCNDGYEPMCVTFAECRTEWVWSHHQTCYLTDGQQSVLGFAAYLEAASCEPGNPPEPITVLDKLGLNRGGVIEVEPQPWGAIKSLCR